MRAMAIDFSWMQQQDSYQNIILLLVFLFTIKFFSSKFLYSKSKLKLPPSPPKLPLIGNIHQFGARPHRSLHKLSIKHGPLMILQMGSFPFLVVSSPEMAREVTITHDLAFASRPPFMAADKIFYGRRDMGFAPYGEHWKRVRKICVLELLGPSMVRSFKSVREDEVESMINKIRRCCSMAESVELGEIVFALMNNVVCRAAFGKKYYEGGFSVLIRQMVDCLGAICVGDFFPWLKWVDHLTGLNSKMDRIAKDIDCFLEKVIEDHSIRKRDEEDESTKQKDFVDVLLQVQQDDTTDVPLSRDDIKAVLLDMFSAGTDTTASTLEWAMAELIKSPSAMQKAQTEVRSVIGSKSKVEEDDVRHMEYLICSVKETLRLHPAVPITVPRESMAPVELKGYHIPQSTRVLINVWALGMDPKSWENPEKFYPERFLTNRFSYLGQDFQYIPFSAGRRSCPGYAFATATIELALANLLYWFDWELPEGAKKEELDMTEGFGIGSRKISPLRLVPGRPKLDMNE